MITHSRTHNTQSQYFYWVHYLKVVLKCMHELNMCHTHHIHTGQFRQTILFYELNSRLSLSSEKQAMGFPFI